MTVWSMTCLPVLPISASCISSQRSVPFAGALADAGEDRVAAVLLGDAGDEFLDDDGLAEPRAAEQARLAAAEERREQVDHLDAGLEHLGLGREVDELRRLAVDRPALGRVSTGPRLSIGSPSRLNTRPSVSLPTGTVTGPPVSTHVHPAAQAVGRAERDRAHASAAEVRWRPRRSGWIVCRRSARSILIAL